MTGDSKAERMHCNISLKNSVDVVLTDIKMNDISGLKLAEEVQKSYPPYRRNPAERIQRF